MDEQRVREIVREELRKNPPVNITFTPDIQITNADAITDRFVKSLSDRLRDGVTRLS